MLPGDSGRAGAGAGRRGDGHVWRGCGVGDQYSGQHRLDRRALLIIAVSLALGLGVAQVPEFLAHMPAAIRNVLESGVATGGICALVLNWFLPEGKEQA